MQIENPSTIGEAGCKKDHLPSIQLCPSKSATTHQWETPYIRVSLDVQVRQLAYTVSHGL